MCLEINVMNSVLYSALSSSTLIVPLSFRITYVQSGPGVTPATPQQATPPLGSAYLQSSLATLGFTAIAPVGQTLVQPPLFAQAPPLSCQSQTPPAQASATAGRQVKRSESQSVLVSKEDNSVTLDTF